MCYDEMSIEELIRRIQYDKDLIRKAGLYDKRKMAIIRDRQTCEKFLEEKIGELEV